MTHPTYPLTSQKVLLRLLEALRRGEKLTTLTAMLNYRCASLSQRLGELRTLGWDIRSETVPNEQGGHHSVYWLHVAVQQELPLTTDQRPVHNIHA
jgi:hypothetical protein